MSAKAQKATKITNVNLVSNLMDTSTQSMKATEIINVNLVENYSLKQDI